MIQGGRVSSSCASRPRCRAGWRTPPPRRSAAEQGVFESGDAEASLSAGGTSGSSSSCIPAALAGLWSKNGPADAFPTTPRSCGITIDLDPGTELPLPLLGGEGEGAFKNPPVVLRGRLVRHQAVLDEYPPRPLARGRHFVVSHPAATPTSIGLIHVRAELVRWSETRILLSSTGFRWIMLLAATLLASFFAVVTSLAPWARWRSKGLVRVFTNWAAYVVAAGCVAAILGTAATLPGRFPSRRRWSCLAGTWLASHATRIHTGRGATALETLGHAFLPGMLVVAASDLSIWTATGDWSDLARLTRLSAALFWVLYHAVPRATLSSTHRPLSAATGLRLVSVPSCSASCCCCPTTS
ncbi:MAG: hypothetical protein U1F87_11230 [Kiritimatiellia bacterium]